MDLHGLAPIRKLDIGILREALNNDNINTDDSQVLNKEVELLPEIFRLIASLEDDTQKMLLDSWAKLEMPLNEKTVSQLLQYLENKTNLSSEEKMAVVKAFAFLKSNGLPYSEKLIDALSSIFNNNDNLSSNIQEYLELKNHLNQDQLNKLFSDSTLSELKNSISKLNSSLENSQVQLNQEAAASAANLNSELTNSNQNINVNNNLDLSPEFLNNFNNLDSELKTIILNNLNSLSKDFDQNTIKILNNFLLNNDIESTSDKIALVKSFAFLKSQQLPLIESLITEFKNIFQMSDLEKFLTNLDNKTKLLNDLNSSEYSLIKENEFSVDLNNKTTNIAQNLADQSKIFDQILSLFNKTEGENEKNIADNFLGQKLANLQQEQNTPLMLALEIPVKIKENKLSSLLLKIEKDEAKNTKNSNQDEYNITFILEFENIGPIKSKVNINKNIINSTFFTEEKKTAELIKNNINKLQSALNKNNFDINKVIIKYFEDFKNEKINFFNNIILNEINDENREGKYRHIDIKI